MPTHDAITEKTFRRTLIPGWIDKAVWGLFVGMITGAISAFTWGLSMNNRVHDVEAYKERIAALERKDDAYRQLVTEVAVMQSLLIAQGKTLDRIVARLDTKGAPL